MHESGRGHIVPNSLTLRPTSTQSFAKYEFVQNAKCTRVHYKHSLLQPAAIEQVRESMAIDTARRVGHTMTLATWEITNHKRMSFETFCNKSKIQLYTTLEPPQTIVHVRTLRRISILTRDQCLSIYCDGHAILCRVFVLGEIMWQLFKRTTRNGFPP